MKTSVLIALLVIGGRAEAQILPAIGSAGFKVGSVHPDRHFQNIPAVGLEIGVGKTARDRRILPFAEYSSGSGSTGKQWRVLSLGVSLLRIHRFRFTEARAFYGGGLGCSFGRFTSTDRNELDLALNALGGVRAPLNRQFDLNLTVKYLLTGNMNHLSAWLGVSYVWETSRTE